MNHQPCKDCQFYGRIKHTLDKLDQRVKYIKPSPGEIPRVTGIDIYGETLPQEGTIGGDHIIYIDFNKRYNLDARINKNEQRWLKEIEEFSQEEILKNPYIQKKKAEKEKIINALEMCKQKAGVLVADVKGHDESGSFMVGMLHQSFLTGALYEMKLYGNITTNLFEKLNTRFYNSSSVDDFFTMIYGEITQNGNFKFISAGHPAPLIFSARKNKFTEIPPDKIINYPPIGVMPSEKDIDAGLSQTLLGYKQEYKISELNLMEKGDILLLFTDGLAELENKDGDSFFPTSLETVLSSKKDTTARETGQAIRERIFDFMKDPQDDITFVLIKKES
jgi:serine phosphatase RsbU (regulator of sigma subunit)